VSEPTPHQYCARYGDHHKPLGFVAIYTMIATFRSPQTPPKTSGWSRTNPRPPNPR